MAAEQKWWYMSRFEMVDGRHEERCGKETRPPATINKCTVRGRQTAETGIGGGWGNVHFGGLTRNFCCPQIYPIGNGETAGPAVNLSASGLDK